jgi:hypothetical protein
VSTGPTQSKQMRFASVGTGINVLVASGYSIAGLVSPQSVLPPGLAATQGSFVFAMYAAARTIPLAVFAFVAIYKRSRCGLLVLGALAGCVQFVDAFVGFYLHDIGKKVGPLVLAVLQFSAVYSLYKSDRGESLG